MTDLPPPTRRDSAGHLPTPSSQTSVPPHPLDSEWYVHLDGETYGPYSGHRLNDFFKEGRIDGATQVLLVGSETWQHVSEDRRLASLFRPARHLSPSPAAVTAAAGATVVQVTNQISPNPMFLMDDLYGAGPKSPGIALLLSFLLCGVGQMYCGRVGKGILMLIGSIALWFIFLGWTVWIWSMIDAYSTAKSMNLKYLRRLQLAGHAA